MEVTSESQNHLCGVICYANSDGVLEEDVRRSSSARQVVLYKARVG